MTEATRVHAYEAGDVVYFLYDGARVAAVVQCKRIRLLYEVCLLIETFGEGPFGNGDRVGLLKEDKIVGYIPMSAKKEPLYESA